MTPQELVTALTHMNEAQGRQMLVSHLSALTDIVLERLVYLLKKEADQHWNTDVQLSLVFSGYLILIGDTTRDRYVHALGLMTRGDALRRLDRNEEALPFFDAAGEEFLVMNDEVGWARTRMGRVSACLHLNRTTEALRDAERAHEIFLRHGKLLRAGQIDVNAAIIHFELGHYDQALRLFDRAIETYTRIGHGIELNIARARGNKALTLAAQGRFREAATLHEQARTTFLQHGEKEEISVAREELNIADIYAAQGHYGQALFLYKQSRALFLKHNTYFAAAEAAQNMCQCLVRLNKLKDAYELAHETVAFFRRTPGQRHNLARSLMHQATAAALLGDVESADNMLREASSVLDEVGFVRLAALARLRRSELYFTDGRLIDSLREAELVADVFADQEDLPHLAQAMLLQGRIADANGDVVSAHELAAQALDIAKGQGLLELQYLAYDLLGQVAEQLGDYEEAVTYYDRAVLGIEDMQSRLVLDERTHFLENKGNIYAHAVLMALKLDKKEQALIYVEKAKSRVLGDYLRNNIDIRLRVGDQVSEQSLQELTKLREEQAWFSSIVYNSEQDTHGNDNAARVEMQKRERWIEQLLEQMQLHTVGQKATQSRLNWTNSIITTIWPSLERWAVMLEYYLVDQDIYIFLVTRRGVDVQIIKGVMPQLERLLALWRTNLDLAGQASGSKDEIQTFRNLQENCIGLLQRLYHILIEPIAQSIQEYKHLTIVPYGMLHYVPFHGLYDGTQFLIEQFYISYLPAAALMNICRKRGERIRGKGVRLEHALVMGLSEGGRLPYAVREAEVVASQLQVPCILNQAARASLLEETGAIRPIVHIAAHGLFRLDAPSFSYIQFSDRQLSTIDVFNLNLPVCSLIVLSACETGRAVIGGIDEVIGLGRGFLYAGAASLLPTLWKVDDESSAELMAIFYQALLEGHAKAEALAIAQRELLKKRPHPYFWAAFQLIGDAGPLFFS